MRVRHRRSGRALFAVGAVVAAVVLAPAAGAITLTPLSTPFNTPVGIDHYEPQNNILGTST